MEALMETPIMFEKFWFDLIWSQIWTQDSQDCESYFCAMPVPHQKSKKYKCRVFKKSLIESKFEPEVIFFQIKFLLFRKSNLTFFSWTKKLFASEIKLFSQLYLFKSLDFKIRKLFSLNDSTEKQVHSWTLWAPLGLRNYRDLAVVCWRWGKSYRVNAIEVQV